MDRFGKLDLKEVIDKTENWDPKLTVEENMRDNRIVPIITSMNGVCPDLVKPEYWGTFLNMIDEELFVPFPDLGHYLDPPSFSSIDPKTGYSNILDYDDLNQKWVWLPINGLN